MTNIVTLDGAPWKAPDALPERTELSDKQLSCLQLLEDYVERARAGHYNELAIVAVVHGSDSIDTVTSEDVGLHYLIAGLEILKFRLLENRDAEY